MSHKNTFLNCPLNNGKIQGNGFFRLKAGCKHLKQMLFKKHTLTQSQTLDLWTNICQVETPRENWNVRMPCLRDEFDTLLTKMS